MDFLGLLLGIYLLTPILGLIGFFKSLGLRAQIEDLQNSIFDLKVRISKLQPSDTPLTATPTPEANTKANADEPISSEIFDSSNVTDLVTPDPQNSDDRQILAISARSDRIHGSHTSEKLSGSPPDSPVNDAIQINSSQSSASNASSGGPKNSHPSSQINWEKRIAANWMVWAGGLALAIGGLFLVRTAIEAGLFNLPPVARCIAGAIFGFGLIGASFRLEKWKTVATAQNAIRFLLPILAGAGIITLYGSALAASALYGMISPIASLIAYASISILAIILAMRHGAALAAIGISGAYLTPFFTGAESGSPLLLLPYIAAISTTALALVRLKSWNFLTAISLLGSILWGLIALSHSDKSLLWATPVYALVLGCIALFFALPFTSAPLNISTRTSKTTDITRFMHQSTITAHLFWLFAGLCISASALVWDELFVGAAMLSLYCGISFVAAWQRQGFSLLVIMAAILSFGLMVIWPSWSTDLSYLALALGIGFFCFGTVLVFFTKHQNKAYFAIAAAISPPLALFIIFGRGNTFDQSLIWGLGALFIATILVSILAKLKTQDTDFTNHPGTAAAYVLGATISVAIAPFLVFSGLWLGTSLAFIALALAFTQSRFPLKIIQYAGLLSVAASLAFLLNPQSLVFGDWGSLWGNAKISTTPIFNEITLCLGLGIIALLFGYRLMPVRSKYARTYQGGAAVLVFGLVGLLIRHTAGNGSLDGPYGGFGEASGYAISYLGAATSLAWRRKSNSTVITIAETVCAIAGFTGVIMGISAISWDHAGSIPIFNLLATSLLMPAIILGAYAMVLRGKSRHQLANIISACSIILGLIWVSSETHRFFTGSHINGFSNVGDDELWVQSVTWLVYAIFLLLLGTWRKVITIRVSSLCILGIVIFKVFLFDMNELEGMLRAFSFIGLGIALIGTALFYQRFVFTTPAQTKNIEDETSKA